jgi:hypothetical protein
MSEDFLSRWSRRKQAAAQAAEPAKSPPHVDSAAAPEPAAGSRAPEGAPESGAPQQAPEPEVAALDPASLPAIESITAETDIRAFLAAGVPAELTRAALRRVWASDPKIRDFVGLADYAWDFNTPGSMAGFGPLEAADGLRAEMARRLGAATAPDSAAGISDHSTGAKPEALASNAAVHDRPNQTSPIMTEDERSPKISASPAGGEPMPPEPEHVAPQQQQESPEDAQSIARRKHGGALPES